MEYKISTEAIMADAYRKIREIVEDEQNSMTGSNRVEIVVEETEHFLDTLAAIGDEVTEIGRR